MAEHGAALAAGSVHAEEAVADLPVVVTDAMIHEAILDTFGMYSLDPEEIPVEKVNELVNRGLAHYENYRAFRRWTAGVVVNLTVQGQAYHLVLEFVPAGLTTPPAYRIVHWQMALSSPEAMLAQYIFEPFDEYETYGRLEDTLHRFAFGQFSDRPVTEEAIYAELGLAVIGADAPGDLRDLGHHLWNWENSWSHAGETGLYALSLLPLIGAVAEFRHVQKLGDLKHLRRLRGPFQGQILDQATVAAKRAEESADAARAAGRYGPDSSDGLRHIDSPNAPKGVRTGGLDLADDAGSPLVPQIHDTAIPLRKLSIDRIRITRAGVAIVERHLAHFVDKAGNAFANNAVMIRDLRRIAAGKMAPTETHLRFYAHELREHVRFRAGGIKPGKFTDQDYANAHYAALSEYSIPWADHGSHLYTDEAFSAFANQLTW